MKKYLKITAFFLAAGLLASCDEDKVVFSGNTDDALVGFVGETAQMITYPDATDARNTYELEVGASNKVNYDRTVVVSINEDESDALPGEYTIDASTYVIPAGQFTAKIKVTGHYDVLPPLVNRTLVFELVSVQDQTSVTIGSEEFTLSIRQTCPKTVAEVYTGTIAGSDFGGTDTPPFDVYPIPVKNPDGSIKENAYSISNLWGTLPYVLTDGGYNEGDAPYPGEMTIACDDTVDFVGQDLSTPGGSGDYDPDLYVIFLTVRGNIFTAQPFDAQIQLVPKE